MSRRRPLPVTGLHHLKLPVADLKDRGAHIHFGSRVAALLGEQRLDAVAVGAAMRRHDRRRQRAHLLVTLAIIRVFREGQAGLRGRL